MKDDALKNKILDWLEKQGYPLELKVAKSFQEQDFSVLQSCYYTDFEEQKPRETDVIARIRSAYEANDEQFLSELETYAVIECKSASKPWICFRGAPVEHGTSDLFLTTEQGRRLIQSVKTKTGKTDLFSTRKHCYAAVLAFNDEGRAFSTMMSVMKASESIFKDRSHFDFSSEEIDLYTYVPLVHAAIITTAPIFECALDDRREVVVNQVAQSTVAFQYPRQREESADSMVIHLINSDNIEAFVRNVASSHEAASEQLFTLDPRSKHEW